MSNYKRIKQQQASKEKYNKENYKSLQVHLEKDLVLQFKDFVKANNFSQSEVIRYLIIEFMENPQFEFVRMKKTDKNFDINKNLNNIIIQGFFSRLEKLKTEDEIIKYFHGSTGYISRKYLLPIANHLGFEFNYQTPRSDVVYAVQKYFLDRL